MASERTNPLGVRVSDRAVRRLDKLAEVYESKTNAIEHAVELLSDPDIAAVIGGGQFAAQQGLLLLCELLKPACLEVEGAFSRAEWNLIADANNGCSPLFNVAGGALRHAPLMVCANVEDDIRLNGGDRKWLDDDPKAAAKLGKELVRKLAALSELQKWAVVLAVQFFWDDAAPRPGSNKIDHQEDEWWTLAYRRRAAKEAAGG